MARLTPLLTFYSSSISAVGIKFCFCRWVQPFRTQGLYSRCYLRPFRHSTGKATIAWGDEWCDDCIELIAVSKSMVPGMRSTLLAGRPNTICTRYDDVHRCHRLLHLMVGIVLKASSLIYRFTCSGDLGRSEDKNTQQTST